MSSAAQADDTIANELATTAIICFIAFSLTPRDLARSVAARFDTADKPCRMQHTDPGSTP